LRESSIEDPTNKSIGNRNNKQRVLLKFFKWLYSPHIDFEQGFFEPSPIDALIQRMGRVNKFGKNSPSSSKVSILTNQIHRFNIYDFKIVEKSLNGLHVLANLISELDLVNVADHVYSNGYSKENQLLYEQALNHPRINKFLENLTAGIYHDWVEDVISELNGTEDMLPISLHKEYEQLNAMGLKIAANNLLVPIPIRIIRFMKENIDMNSDPWIINVPYSKEN
jgi:hypothetical protein